MDACSENWRTCGHCVVGSYAEPYPACDKAGLVKKITGGDVCPNAPWPDEREATRKEEDR